MDDFWRSVNAEADTDSIYATILANKLCSNTPATLFASQTWQDIDRCLAELWRKS